MTYGSNIQSKIVFSQLSPLTESEFVLLGTFSQGVKIEIRAQDKWCQSVKKASTQKILPEFSDIPTLITSTVCQFESLHHITYLIYSTGCFYCDRYKFSPPERGAFCQPPALCGQGECGPFFWLALCQLHVFQSTRRHVWPPSRSARYYWYGFTWPLVLSKPVCQSLKAACSEHCGRVRKLKRFSRIFKVLWAQQWSC